MSADTGEQLSARVQNITPSVAPGCDSCGDDASPCAYLTSEANRPAALPGWYACRRCLVYALEAIACECGAPLAVTSVCGTCDNEE